MRRIVINPLSVCLSVRQYSSGTAGPIGASLRIPGGRGLVLLWRRCDTLCTSCFVDDVTFGRIGRDTETWMLHRAATAMNGEALPWRSVMSMNACLEIVINACIFDVTLGGRVVSTSDSRLAVEGSPPGHDTAWLFISETGDRLWRVNCLGNCNHHPGQLSLASFRGR